MGIFEQVALTWAGKEYIIPPEQMLRCIAAVEDVVTLGELAAARARGKIPFAKVARAYGACLRFAGCDVTDEQVYAGMFEGQGKNLQRISITAVMLLQAMMVPPASLRGDPGKAEPAPGRKRRAASSRRSTG